MMIKAGSIFVIALSVVAALLFAAHNPPFWLLFGLSTLFLIIGLYVFRATVKNERNVELELNSRNISIHDFLNEAKRKIQELISSTEANTTDNYWEKLNAIKLSCYLPFTENSTFIIDKYGMKTYADLMIPFAFSERLLNRSLSAAIDKNRGESLQALKDCYEHFQDVIQILDLKN